MYALLLDLLSVYIPLEMMITAFKLNLCALIFNVFMTIHRVVKHLERCAIQQIGRWRVHGGLQALTLKPAPAKR